MIKNQDRIGWFGASDIDYIVGNRNTKSFENWWMVKLGLSRSHFTNTAMIAGTYKEHQILDYVAQSQKIKIRKDKQIKIRKLRLRVNLDGNTKDTILEVKTHKYDGKPFKVPLKYLRQVWVQMYASKLRKAYIIAYAMKEEDYQNFFLPIDPERLEIIPVEYNHDFIYDLFLPSIIHLAASLVVGVFPP